MLSTARSDGDVIYKIEYGQTLWSLAIAYQTTIDQIRLWNNLGQETTIYEGQILLVQKGATPPPAATLTPRASSTPGGASAERRTTASATATVPPSTMSSGEDLTSRIPEIGIRVALILVLFALGGMIAGWVIQRRN